MALRSARKTCGAIASAGLIANAIVMDTTILGSDGSVHRLINLGVTAAAFGNLSARNSRCGRSMLGDPDQDCRWKGAFAIWRSSISRSTANWVAAMWSRYRVEDVASNGYERAGTHESVPALACFAPPARMAA